MLKNPIFRGSARDPAEGAYSYPPDPVADEEGLAGRCPSPKNPPPVLGPSGLVYYMGFRV